MAMLDPRLARVCWPAWISGADGTPSARSPGNLQRRRLSPIRAPARLQGKT
jgi:hypothetical protein